MNILYLFLLCASMERFILSTNASSGKMKDNEITTLANYKNGYGGYNYAGTYYNSNFGRSGGGSYSRPNPGYGSGSKNHYKPEIGNNNGGFGRGGYGWNQGRRSNDGGQGRGGGSYDGGCNGYNCYEKGGVWANNPGNVPSGSGYDGYRGSGYSGGGTLGGYERGGGTYGVGY